MNPVAAVMIVAYITSTIAIFNGFATTFTQARIACVAIDAIARQPEARGPITTAMFASLAMAETGGIYGLVVSIIILFPNPILNNFIQYLV
ncbi:MAG: F0F1 ATP synthase subunit C [Defluviitaleaceae bacterium]|nr:F0F1 ATP synthase subunit C [Defluviitaleaceae bacterium]